MVKTLRSIEMTITSHTDPTGQEAMLEHTDCDLPALSNDSLGSPALSFK